jgi:hypothetical protein
MKYNAAQTAVRVSLMEKWKTILSILVVQIQSITTAKTGIDLGNEKSISDVLIYPNPCFYLERKND